MTKPLLKLSIITATRNSEARISPLLSAIEKTYAVNAYRQCVEWVVQDCISHDQTVELIKTRAPLAKVESSKDSSLFEAWNKALLRSTGTHCIFLGDDDFFDVDLVALFLRQSDHSQALAFDVRLMRSGRRYGFAKAPQGRYLPTKTNEFCHPGIIFPSTLYQGKSFDERFSAISDMIFYFNCDEIPFIKISSPQPLVFMEITGVTGAERSALLILSEYLLAVYQAKIKFSYSFFARKSLMVLALPLGPLSAIVKKLRWSFF
jgi:glycosyltransferase involved in cell wall biosynthesis